MDIESPDDVTSRDRQLAAELEALNKEQHSILSSLHSDDSPLFRDILNLTKRRLQLATDHRDMELRHLADDYHLQRLQADNEFERGKRVLRAEILSVAVDRRKRIDNIRHAPVRKKRRGRTLEKYIKRKIVRQPFLDSLERQGIVRVSATPDEVNNDLEMILSAIENRKSNGMNRASSNPGNRVQESSKTNDRVLVSKSILHYYDSTFEKGDRVAVFHNPKSAVHHRSTPKYTGVLLAVNQKEVTVRTDSGKFIPQSLFAYILLPSVSNITCFVSGIDHRVFVSHLLSGKFLMKPTAMVENPG